MRCWTFRRASRTARSNWRSHSRIAGWVCTPTTRPSTPATSNTRSLPGPSSATFTTVCTITWWRCSSRRRRTGSCAHDAGRRAAGGEGPPQRSNSIPALHGGGALPSAIRLLQAHTRSLWPTRRLFHGGTDPAGLRHSDGAADSPSPPPDGLSARVYGGRTGIGTARDGGGIRRVELRAGGYRFGCDARRLRRRCFLQRVLRCASGGCRGVPERRFPRTTGRAGGRRVPLAHQRSGGSKRGPLPAPLLPAARGRPLVRSEPGGLGVARAYGGGVIQRIRAQRRLRFHARRERAFSGGHADGIPAGQGARRRAGRSRAARHHGARELHRARRERRRVWARDRALRDAGANAAGCRRTRWVRGGAWRGRRGGGVAPPHATQDAAVRNGRDVPGAVAEENRKGRWRRESEGKALNNEKGPGNRGLEVITCLQPLFRATSRLLLFLRSSLFLRGGFLGCALNRLILPNIKFCDSKIAM